MSTWDQEIFSAEANADFLDELAQLEPEEILEAVSDAVLLAAGGNSASEEEILNGQAAATIAAIWAGAPFSAGEIAESYPFIRSNPGEVSEQLNESAVTVLEKVSADADADSDTDIDQFIEALS
ncbi:hypothetical protein CGLAU_02840 [Corynebacterium glaucum]|uniref:DUF4259 domain-containing protein n=1 Tax=Corynebacterium glaucum TaxID=187491 RepID=A0A1Q2HUN8_9CORY|nr:DUF4259 domain-containing protein [Corynebacterium glaucum]AQQ14553.1 hypothetical protein CGLAU_02840 [Corynebacterium glaucum]WJZ07082.1 hypothetical protein CGLAUT_02880 [Corynebacterium glaucum]